MKSRAIGLLLILFLSGCANAGFTLHFPLDENGPFEKASRTEICKARQALSAMQVHPDPQLQGLVVFDGTLIAAKRLPKDKQEISMQVEAVLLGAENHVPKQLEVISPTERNGGVTIAIGEKYRAMVLPIREKYYTWAALGTAPKDRVFGGFYGCSDK